MAAVMGKYGTINFGAATSGCGYIDTWVLNSEIGTAEITAYGDSFKAVTSTLRSWTVQASGTLDKADSEQDAMLDLIAATSDPGDVQLRMYMVSTDNDLWYGNARLNTVAINSVIADKVSVSFSFIGNGALAFSATGYPA